MKLSERLDRIAEEIEKGETVADIGTDHGYLPLFLYMTEKSPKVIFADISEDSLNKAKECCKELCPHEKFEFRRGDGLDTLNKGEVDAVTIAGMGGMLMTDILEWDMEKTCSIKKFVFQPRNNPGYLRRWLLERDFRIVKESIVREGDFLCEIITALSPESFTPDSLEEDFSNKRRKEGRSSRRNFDRDECSLQMQYEFPLYLVQDPCDLTEEYLRMHLEKAKVIRKRIQAGCKQNLSQHRDYIYMTIQQEHIENLLQILEDNRG